MRVVLLMAFLTILESPAFAKARPEPREKEINLATASFKEILDRYVFIADFNQKPAERPVTTEYMWKYPFKPGPVKFELDLNTQDMRKMVYQIKGGGPKTEIFNIGRVAFMEGDYDRAHEVWLQGRQAFKDDAVTNRAFEFFLGINALTIYKTRLDAGKGQADDEDSKKYLQRAAYFLAAAFILRKDAKEERVSEHAAWGLYNLAVIYYKFDRIPSAYGAATEGLSALLSQGKTSHRPHFRQLLAEAHIRNQDLISAIQELDTAIRQDPDPREAAKMFNRAADIYYDLNNYELAIDMYAMASAIDRERLVYNPAQAILRAESQFWLGKFAESASLFKGAVEHSMRTPGNEWLYNSGMLPWAWLRVADAGLLRALEATGDARKKSLDAARLAYFKVQSEFPKTEAARIAEIRGACMELPRYEGNNVNHARELLNSAMETKNLPEILTEMIMACETQSWVDREKSDKMVTKVREFSDRYPQSRYLSAMLEPVRDVNATKIEPYFEKKQWAEATEFFEAKRKVLFPKVSKALAANLWLAYVETTRSAEAREYWPEADKAILSDESALRQAAFLLEVMPNEKSGKYKTAFDTLNSKLGTREWKKKPSSTSMQYMKRIMATKDVVMAYPWIMNLTDSWTDGDNDALCAVKFPLWSRVYNDKRSSKASRHQVAERVKKLPDKVISGEKDTTCQQSLLDFESRTLVPSELERKYQARGEWPLTGAWLERMWTWAEEMNSRGQRDKSVAVWKLIAEKGPAEAFETKMSRQRLDPRKTEYESLWKK